MTFDVFGERILSVATALQGWIELNMSRASRPACATYTASFYLISQGRGKRESITNLYSTITCSSFITLDSPANDVHFSSS